MVVLDKQDDYNHWAMQPGFTKPTHDEIETFVAERETIIRDMHNHVEVSESTRNIHFASVSPGGTDGYGIASYLLVKELKKLGFLVKTYYDSQQVAILFHNPYSITSLESPYRIIYTMFESDKIPDDWKDYLEAADLVVVPSRWCQSVFKNAGIDSVVIPLGYDESVFTYIDRRNKREENEYFTFLHYNAYNVRKGFLEVFKAFTKEFTIDEPVKMIFKTTVPNPYQRFPINTDIYRNIEIITGQTSAYDMQQLIKRSDCFVFPSRGEGFGVPPLECMATGLPVIVPNAHGITEYFDSKYMYEVKVAGSSPAMYSRYKGIDVGQMVTCDVDDLRRQMRWVYEHQTEAIEKGRRSSEYVQQWTMNKCAIAMKEAIEALLTKPPKDRKHSNFLALELVK